MCNEKTIVMLVRFLEKPLIKSATNKGGSRVKCIIMTRAIMYIIGRGHTGAKKKVAVGFKKSLHLRIVWKMSSFFAFY